MGLPTNAKTPLTPRGRGLQSPRYCPNLPHFSPMTESSNHSFWREFWPKALFIAGVVLALWLLEHYGIIRRW